MMRRSLVGGGVIVTVVLGTVAAFAAGLNVAPSILATFNFPAGVVRYIVIPATVDLKPESLQKRSVGVPVTGFIELPAGFDVLAIDVATVRLCLGTSPCGSTGVQAASPKWGDADQDGVPDLKAQFSRSGVIALVADVVPPASVSFTVSGLVSGRTFAGSDTLKLVDPAQGEEPSPDPSPEPSPSPFPSPSPETTTSPSPEDSPSPPPSEESSPEPSPSPSAETSPSPEASHFPDSSPPPAGS